MDVFTFIYSFKTIAPIEAMDNYQAIEFKKGKKYVVNFKSGKQYYLAFSENVIKPFMNNEYIGAIIAVRDAKQLLFAGKCYIRYDGQAVILCDRVTQRYITPVGEYGHLFYLNTGHDEKEREMPIEDYLEYLRDEFKGKYFRLWVGEPNVWEKCFNGILQRIRPLNFVNGKVVIV